MSAPWLLVAIRPGLALRLPRPGRWMNVLRRILGLMMLGSAIWLATLLLPHFGFTASKSAQDTVQWQPLSEQAIQSALAQHKRVFVDVTADWCITCKVNKYNVLQKRMCRPPCNSRMLWRCGETGRCRPMLLQIF